MSAALAEMFFRWLHLLAGVLWIGLLYYFNFVQVPYLKGASAEAKADAFKGLVPRALLWFRYAALVTWLVGVLWLAHRGTLIDSFTFQGANAIIGTGAWLGTIMATIVWVVIWPNQKKVLGIVPASAEQKAKAARRAFLASRTNAMLSIPMLFFMGAAMHLSVSNPTSGRQKLGALVLLAVVMTAAEINALVGTTGPAKKMLGSLTQTFWAGFILTAVLYFGLAVIF
jgi:uncharacterized membrane protein